MWLVKSTVSATRDAGSFRGRAGRGAAPPPRHRPLQGEGNVFGPEAEVDQGLNHAAGILRAYGHPDIHVTGRTWVTMVANRIPADEKVLNVSGMQQSQELSEVGR